MRRNLAILVVLLVAVPVVLLAGVDRSGGQMYFIKQYGQRLFLQFSSLNNGQQLSIANEFGDPTRQLIYHTTRGELVVGGAPGEQEKCVVLENNAQGTNKVILWSCSGNAQWNEKWQLNFAQGQIKHVNHGGCLENSSGRTIIAPCNTNAPGQKWFFEKARGASYGHR